MTDDTSAARPATPVLDRVHQPADLKDLSDRELRQLADELRAETISAVSVTGGHLGAGLGVVELTVALHAVFDTPRDKIIWDVGHQCYPHKILTGRRDRIRTLRMEDGLSGFTKRSESPYDPFGTAHSSTSLSAGLGFAVARDLNATEEHVVAVIGDGALTGGLAMEGLNNIGAEQRRLVIVLNDNNMSISRNVGSMASYLSKIRTEPSYFRIKGDVVQALDQLPVIGHQYDRLDQGAQRFTNFEPVLVRQRLLQRCDLLPIDLCQPGMQPRLRLGGRRQLGLEGLPPPLQRLHPRIHRRLVQTLLDRPQ